MKSFSVIGEDRRQKAAADFLKEAGYKIIAQEKADTAEYVLFPMPFSLACKKEIAVLEKLPEGSVAFGGKIAEEIMEEAQEKKMILLDYLKQGELAQYNAIPTAEGALQILMENSEKTLWNSRIAVLGYGRIGKLLCRLLSSFGAKVIIADRKAEKRAEAESAGLQAIDIAELKLQMPQQEVIINTIPAQILSKQLFEKTKQELLVLDLASMPGGVEKVAIELLGDRYVQALGIPTKYAPVTAGRFVAKTVLHMISEKR